MPDNSHPGFGESGDGEPDDDFRDMLRDFLAGNSEIDPSKLASAAGVPNDPALVAQLMSKLQDALQNSGDGINWDLAMEQAKAVASRERTPSLPAERDHQGAAGSLRGELHRVPSIRLDHPAVPGGVAGEFARQVAP